MPVKPVQITDLDPAEYLPAGFKLVPPTNLASYTFLDPNGKVKRPPNSFFLMRTELLKCLSRTPNSAMASKVASVMWKNMTEEEKEPWVQLQDALKAKHAMLYPWYKFTPGKKGSKRKLDWEEEDSNGCGNDEDAEGEVDDDSWQPAIAGTNVAGRTPSAGTGTSGSLASSVRSVIPLADGRQIVAFVYAPAQNGQPQRLVPVYGMPGAGVDGLDFQSIFGNASGENGHVMAVPLSQSRPYVINRNPAQRRRLNDDRNQSEVYQRNDKGNRKPVGHNQTRLAYDVPTGINPYTGMMQQVQVDNLGPAASAQGFQSPVQTTPVLPTNGLPVLSAPGGVIDSSAYPPTPESISSGSIISNAIDGLTQNRGMTMPLQATTNPFLFASNPATTAASSTAVTSDPHTNDLSMIDPLLRPNPTQLAVSRGWPQQPANNVQAACLPQAPVNTAPFWHQRPGGQLPFQNRVGQATPLLPLGSHLPASIFDLDQQRIAPENHNNIFEFGTEPDWNHDTAANSNSGSEPTLFDFNGIFGQDDK
ncbi:hypothetical protein CVT24_011371 [Panaeolus cyanescens]|uniref:HMG box domain-containing protein n=1 Tax=Panaeolus cyanescens TaxID=181874 RepID=A0A409YGN8_9AGAR|nr:hypothetical protein CVT24_011371 [Panaeolus cyanescens]